MKLVFYSLVLNHHQACVADEFYKLLGSDYAFVETAECYINKGATEDYSKRPYLIQAWKSAESWSNAIRLAEAADVCVFSGFEALPFEIVRMKRGMLSFDMSERMLKRGWLNIASPRILKMIMAYHLYGWSKKPLYKLCMSAYTKEDQYKLHSFKDKCYKWGYFIKTPNNTQSSEKDIGLKTSDTTIKIMWCARFLTWKHPEMPVELAARLKSDGYDFRIEMFGGEGMAAKHDGVYSKSALENLIRKFDVADIVELCGNKPNDKITTTMRKSDIFLFTSDRQEGWGVVANESMANGCVLVASDAIGSTHYLVKHKETGMIFRSCDLDSLYEQVKYLLDNPEARKQISKAGRESMVKLWSPANAAKSMLQLIEDTQAGRETSIAEGPCSKA